jgi:hypothetical protein
MSHRVTFLCFLLLVPVLLFAGTTGKLKGKVTDLKTGEPLIGANVIVVGTSLGAQTGSSGEYSISNLSAGTYTLRCSFISYKTVTVHEFRIYADLTSEYNFQLPGEGVTTAVVEVTAIRPLVNKNATNANRITTGEELEAIPVRGLNNIIALTPGVVYQDKTVFIRGGRQDEVGFFMEGQSITNPMVGGRAVTIIQDAVEEIQVQSGGYPAEYGGSNAGIIYTQIKSGTPDLKVSAEGITDNVGFQGKGSRYNGKERLGAYWYGYSEFTGTVSGSLLDKRLKLFGLFNSNYQADPNPQAYPGINIGTVGDVASGDTVNLKYPAGALTANGIQTYTGTASVQFDMNPIILRAVGTYTRRSYGDPWSSSRISGDIANMFNTVRTEQIDAQDGAFSFKATHILSPTTYYELSAGYSFNKTHVYDPFLQDNFMSYGDSAANAKYGFIFPSHFTRPTQKNIYGFVFNSYGDVVSGYQKSENNHIDLNAALTTTLGKVHSIKVGGGVQLFTIRNYSFGNEGLFALPGLFYNNDLRADGDPLKVTHDQIILGQGVNNYGYDLYGNVSDSDPNAKAKKPILANGYIQDKIEYRDLVLNVGVRLDYIQPDNKQFVDPTRPDLGIDQSTGKIKADGWKDVPSFTAVSPRLGFSFPVTDKTVFHAQFGKFVQQSRLRDMYQGMYATAYNLRGGFEITAPVGFNIRPTRTTQYEIGFNQQIGDVASFDITGYYKDILDQIVFDKVTVVPGHGFQDYNVLKNGDFATTKGIEFSFTLRRVERLQATASLSFNDAEGTGSFPNSNRGIVGAPLDGVTIFSPRYISPLEYNNAFRGNFKLDYRFGENDGPNWVHQLGAYAVISFNSGHPYTLGIGGSDLEGDARNRQPIEALNSSTTPWNFQIDLRVDKTFALYGKLNANIYIDVVNLLDTKNIQNVFLRTGSTSDDGYLSNPSLGGKLVQTNGAIYEQLYRAINIDYYQQYQAAVTGAPYTTSPYFFGAPRQIKLGIRLEY